MARGKIHSEAEQGLALWIVIFQLFIALCPALLPQFPSFPPPSYYYFSFPSSTFCFFFTQPLLSSLFLPLFSMLLPYMGPQTGQNATRPAGEQSSVILATCRLCELGTHLTCMCLSPLNSKVRVTGMPAALGACGQTLGCAPLEVPSDHCPGCTHHHPHCPSILLHSSFRHSNSVRGGWVASSSGKPAKLDLHHLLPSPVIMGTRRQRKERERPPMPRLTSDTPATLGMRHLPPSPTASPGPLPIVISTQGRPDMGSTCPVVENTGYNSQLSKI